MAIDAIVLHTNDNVATAVQELKTGQQATIRLGRELNQLTLAENIPYGHKFSIRTISLGENILKYGEVIGRATVQIEAGRHAHVQNIESLRGRGDLGKEEQ
ncbi:Altronate dehydratase [bioreactor metagenome]|uniref:Altronate dehydratase n=1 Tax=bioreactor metagenome TaxID=1076179 RepID=A0A644SVA0_9ZZZZ|nr:UxaA family hydrolase [Negativicutes bacterium]